MTDRESMHKTPYSKYEDNPISCLNLKMDTVKERISETENSTERK